MDSENSEKIFDIDGYLGKAPEETNETPESAPIEPDKAGEIGAEAVDVAEKTAVDPQKLKYRRNRIIVALVAAGILIIVGVFFLIDLIDKNNFRERNRENYQQTLATLAESEKTFNKTFEEYSYSVYGLSGAPAINDIYPTEDGIATAKSACLERFGIGIGEHFTLQARSNEPEDYVEAEDELSRISNSFIRATTGIDKCRVDIVEPIAAAFGIEYGKMTFEEDGAGYRMIMPSKIGYTGERRIETVVLGFSLFDENGQSLSDYREDMMHKFDRTINTSKKLDFDPFLIKTDSGGITRTIANGANKANFAKATVGVYSISGSFQAQTDK